MTPMEDSLGASVYLERWENGWSYSTDGSAVICPFWSCDQTLGSSWQERYVVTEAVETCDVDIYIYRGDNMYLTPSPIMRFGYL